MYVINVSKYITECTNLRTQRFSYVLTIVSLRPITNANPNVNYMYEIDLLSKIFIYKAETIINR